MSEEIKFPPRALLKAQQLSQIKATAQMQFETYVNGVFDGLGLDGNWNLDVDTWTFKLLPKSKMAPTKPEDTALETKPEEG